MNAAATNTVPEATTRSRPPAGRDVPLLDVVDLHTNFRTEHAVVRAVDGVSLTLEQGRTLGVVGESGSGKTVLSRSIMGLLPRRNVIRRGQVLFEGDDIAQLDEERLSRIWGARMAMVFQDPMTSLNPVVRIGRQLTEHVRLHNKVSKAHATERAVELLDSVGIPEPKRRLDEYPHQLSGGMRQRVMIAIALACSPKLLLADEPTTALDVTVQSQILDLLSAQQRERDMAMVLVTHDLGVVAGRTDDIAVMYAGKIVEKAPTRTLFANMRMPYTEALIQSIPRLANPSHSRLNVIPGRPPDMGNPPAGCRFAPRCAYAQDRCREEQPPLVAADQPGHAYACWYPVGTPEGRDALARNQREGRVQAATAPAAGAGAGGTR
ncbi:MAG TPA: ABC transporter ATP-binding protein [Acidimicrobiales bacterium]|nr:ABC transporter ATP-binding protein [Acidimicrobiales bacterium]